MGQVIPPPLTAFETGFRKGSILKASWYTTASLIKDKAWNVGRFKSVLILILTASSVHMFTPTGAINNGYPTPTHALENVTSPSHVRLPGDFSTSPTHVPVPGELSTPPNHVRLPGDLTTPPNPVRLPGDLTTPPNHVRLPGDLSTPPSQARLPGGPSSPLPNVGLTRFKPSPEVAMLGPLSTTAVIPVTSTHSSSGGSQKPMKASLPAPSTSKQIVPVVSNKSRSRKGTCNLCFRCRMKGLLK